MSDGYGRALPDLEALTSAGTLGALSGASREEADALLKKQRRLIDLQIENLEKLDEFELSHLRWRRFNDQMRGALQIMMVAVGALIVIAIASAMWSASHDDGLVIESFSVPPDMAARGLDGQVVASQLLDKLTHMQNQTSSMRPARSFANDWGGDIKVQIPETGISAGEAYRFLVQWLGHQTHINGEVFRNSDGISVTARVGGGDGATFSGAEKDLDALEQKAAERIYVQTQPYRYAVYEVEKRNFGEARHLFGVLAESDSNIERAWAHVGLGSLEEDSPSGDERLALAEYRKAMRDDPDLTLAANDIAIAAQALGLDELRIAEGAHIVSLNEQGKFLNASCAAINTFLYDGDAAFFHGDYREAEVQFAQGEVQPGCPSNAEVAHTLRAISLALHHDGDAALAAATPPNYVGSLSQANGSAFYQTQESAIARLFAHFAKQDWVAVRTIESAPGDASTAARRLTAVQPLLALARAEQGDTAAADALIAATPLDCYFCVRARGRIAAIEKNWKASARWFDSATKLAPSLPSAWSEWGETLLRKGDLDGAIAKFTIANQKGPHFADPLEFWGEALVAENRSDLALAKFAEANQYAPHWGRLHLKWGEALRYAGQPDEASRQFAVAAHIFLTAPEHAALARDAHG